MRGVEPAGDPVAHGGAQSQGGQDAEQRQPEGEQLAVERGPAGAMGEQVPGDQHSDYEQEVCGVQPQEGSLVETAFFFEKTLFF